MTTRFVLAFIATLTLACGAEAPAPPRLEPDSDLASLQRAARWPNREPSTLTTLAALYSSTGHDSDGYAFFSELVEAEPENGTLLAVRAMMRAQMAGQIELTSRVAWVETAIAELDRAVELDPNLPRYLRAIVFSNLPARFETARRAAEEIEDFIDDPGFFLATDVVPTTTRDSLVRQAYQALGRARDVLGETEQADRAWAMAGGRPDDPDAPLLVTGFSVNATDGFRFVAPELVPVAPDVHVARGYDFADIAFVQTSEGVVVIDAGTSEANAARALADYRREVTDAPIHTVFVTHAHWDHIGGLAAVREPGTRVVAQTRFAAELARVNAAGRDYAWFFGEALEEVPDDVPLFTVEPDVVVGEDQVVVIGAHRFALYPVGGGETEDALLIHLVGPDIVFVGDAFMPYLGSPFIGEGSPEALIDVIERLIALGPDTLVHGHGVLTELFTAENLDPMRRSLLELRRLVRLGVRESRPLAEILHSALLPDLLQDHPSAVLPVYVIRQGFVQRLHREMTGYWQPDGSGIEVVGEDAWASALDLLAGSDEGRWGEVVASLNRGGDFALAHRLAERGVRAHPESERLRAGRIRALRGLRERYQSTNPFKLIIYSQQAGEELP